jgi:hypothetical protein
MIEDERIVRCKNVKRIVAIDWVHHHKASTKSIDRVLLDDKERQNYV